MVVCVLEQTGRIHLRLRVVSPGLGTLPAAFEVPLLLHPIHAEQQ